ncbi:Major facilitator superfamily domain [Phytophthora cactorum]|nr:Major facilitator superfamily domain [Phytophthora cactorum]
MARTDPLGAPYHHLLHFIHSVLLHRVLDHGQVWSPLWNTTRGLLQAGGAGLRTQEPYVTVLGQLLASFAMPFMVNSPAVLSSNWFPSSMRATSTSVAINANAMGTAIVYLIAPFVVLSSGEVPFYNFCIAVLAGSAWVVALLFFQSYPKSGHDQFVPISHLEDDYDWSQWANAFSHSGFWHTAVAFSIAECVLNAMCALLTKFLSVTNFLQLRSAFLEHSLVGSQIISREVDKMRSHKAALQLCLLLVALGIALFRLVPKVEIHFTLLSLLFLGFVLGPVQPIALELGSNVHSLPVQLHSCFEYIATNTFKCDWSRNFVHFLQPEWILVLMTTTTFIIICCLYGLLVVSFDNDGEHKRYAHESKIIPPEELTKLKLRSYLQFWQTKFEYVQSMCCFTSK